jgi:glycosyltransferase involved in cell wall biosynthesis
MRILLWQELFWPHIGGIEILSTKLLCALRERGHEVVVVTRRDSPDLPCQSEYQGIPVYRFSFPWTAFSHGKMDALFESRRQVTRLKQSFRPELVHMNSFGPSFLLYHDSGGAKPVPFLVTLHTTPQSIFSEQAINGDGLYKRTLCSAGWISCVSAAVLDQARHLMPEISSRSSVIYNGMQVPDLAPEPLPFTPPCVLCLGRLIPDKGFDLALAAFAAIADRFPQLRLMIAGDGPARVSLEKQAAALGVTGSVDFVGWVPPEKVAALLNAATLVVMPSYREGLPTVALEAALMARPVVGTQVGGFPEVVLHQKTGWLVLPGDENSLAEALLLLLGEPRLAVALGEAARMRAQETFSFGRYIDAYENLYSRLIWEAR